MDEARYSLRDFRGSDYDALAALQNAIDPEEPVSVESLRHMVESFREASQVYDVVVEDRHSKEVVGTGAVWLMPSEGDPKTMWIFGGVLPNHQRAGIGSFVYDTLLAEARRRGATGLRCRVSESSMAGRTFLAKRNFAESRRVWRSSLDVASADTSQLPALVRAAKLEGVEFTTLSQEGVNDPGVQREVYDLDSETGRDVPHDGTYSPFPFEEWRQFFLKGENALPDAWYLAKKGNRYVALTSAAREVAQPDVLQQFFTGTRSEVRRKGLARTLKLMLIDYAKTHGYARIETSNDSLNTPMWTLNRTLGFRKVRETIQFESHLT